MAALKMHRRELIDPKIAEHKGRIVKTTSDGLLIEFPSVVEAVQCAVEIQRAMQGRNIDVPADHRIEFRVGVNLGDIIMDGDDIYGDGVEAQRLDRPGRISASCPRASMGCLLVANGVGPRPLALASAGRRTRLPGASGAMSLLVWRGAVFRPQAIACRLSG